MTNPAIAKDELNNSAYNPFDEKPIQRSSKHFPEPYSNHPPHSTPLKYEEMASSNLLTNIARTPPRPVGGMVRSEPLTPTEDEWQDRTQIITKTEHHAYQSWAKDFVTEIAETIIQNHSPEQPINESIPSNNSFTGKDANPMLTPQANRNVEFFAIDELKSSINTPKNGQDTKKNLTGSNDKLISQSDVNNYDFNNLFWNKRQVAADVAEFDPFNSFKESSSNNLISLIDSSPIRVRQDQKPSSGSLLDTEIEHSTRHLKYSEKDIELLRKSIIDQTEKEAEVVQAELFEMTAKLKKETEKRIQLQKVLEEYELTIAKIIDDNKKQKDESAHRYERTIKERDRLKTDLNNVEASFVDLRQKYEDAKQIQEAYRTSDENLRQQLENLQYEADKRCEAAIKQGEEKLAKAGLEVTKVSNHYEKEIVAYKARATRAEMKVKNLENIIEQKTEENSELTNLCDDLISKLGKE